MKRREKSESPRAFAQRLGLLQFKAQGDSSYSILSWPAVEDLAVKAYWARRGSDARVA